MKYTPSETYTFWETRAFDVKFHPKKKKLWNVMHFLRFKHCSEKDGTILSSSLISISVDSNLVWLDFFMQISTDTFLISCFN